MKIVQVQTQAEAAGAQRVSDVVGQGLRERGHQVRTVFMYRKTDAYDADPHADFILDDRPRGFVGYVKACLGLVAYVQRERPDAVVSYQHYGNVFGTLAAVLAGTSRRIVNQSGAPGKRGGMLIAAWIDHVMGALGLYQYSIVNSQWTADQFDSYTPAYRGRLRRIDHGVAMPKQPIDRQAARRKFQLPADAKIVVSSGRLTRDKNQAAIIEALALLPGVHLAVAGVGPDSGALQHLAVDRGVSERVHLVGELGVEGVFDLLAAADVYAFASRHETFGLAAVEAAVTGLPVVSNDLAVLREVLTGSSGPAALFVDVENAATFAAALRRALDDVSLRDQLAMAGRSLTDRYSPDVMCSRYDELVTDRRAVAGADRRRNVLGASRNAK